MTIVDPIRDQNGWAFRDPSGKIPPGASFESTDPINGFHFLSEAYKATDPDYNERVTVPVLWDKQTKKIVNNSEDDICRMFNDVFNDFAKNKDVDYFPKHTRLPVENYLRRLINWRNACRRVAFSSTTALSNPIGDFSAHSSDSTWFITATSSAICAALSITQICRVT